MKRVVYGDRKFLIIKISRGNETFFTVVRKNMPKEYHAHFDNIYGAKMIIKLYWKQEIPKSEYLLQSLKRLCTNKELIQRKIY